MNKSILIIGRISSGKSTIAKAIQSSAQNRQIISFGGYLKNYSEMRQMKVDRQSLQDLGQKFIDESPATFLKKVVEYNQVNDGEVLIFEGVRHKLILEAISMHYPILLSIYLDIDQRVRYERFISRGKSIDRSISWKEFLKSDNHQVELQTESLKNDCDLILGEASLKDCINNIEERIRQ